MAIEYIIQARESYYGEERKKRYFLIAKSSGRIGRQDLIEYMTQNASLTPSEASSALDYLLEAIPHFLRLGKRVDLGSLGSMKATIRSEGSDKKEDADVHKVREICVHYTPSIKLKTLMQKTSLERREPTGKYRLSLRQVAALRKELEIEMRQKKELARKGLAKGLDPVMIAELTGLSEDEIGLLQ